MLKFRLNKSLFDYASPVDNKPRAILRLLKAAETENFTEALVLVARTFNPGNEKLAQFAHEFGLDSIPPNSKIEFQRIVDDTNENLDPVQLRHWIFDAEIRVCRVEVKAGGKN